MIWCPWLRQTPCRVAPRQRKGRAKDWRMDDKGPLRLQICEAEKRHNPAVTKTWQTIQMRACGFIRNSSEGERRQLGCEKGQEQHGTDSFMNAPLPSLPLFPHIFSPCLQDAWRRVFDVKKDKSSTPKTHRDQHSGNHTCLRPSPRFSHGMLICQYGFARRSQ